MDAFYVNVLSPRLARGINCAHWLAQLLLIMAILSTSAQEFFDSKDLRSVSQNLQNNEISESTNSVTRFARRYDTRRVSLTTSENCKNSVDCGSESAGGPKVTYEDAYRFRAQQCAEFNKKSYNGQNINWQPYLRDRLDECKLHCLAAGHKFYARLKNSVKDGTPCGKYYSNVCIKGKCQKRPKGCLSLDGPCVAEARKKILGVFNSTTLNLGYNLVTTVPAGATNITIEELTRSRSYLALKDHKGGTYHLNGHWMISLSKKFKIGTSHVTYIRNGNTPRGGEMIKIDGPLDKSLDIMLIYRRHPTIIMYSYLVTKDEYKRLKHQSRTEGQHLYFPKGRGISQPTQQTQNDRLGSQTNGGKQESITFIPGQKRGAYPSTTGEQGFRYPYLSTGQRQGYGDGQNQGGKQAARYGSSWVQFGGDESGSKQTAEPATQYARKPFLHQQVFKPNQFSNSRLPQDQGSSTQRSRFGDTSTSYQRTRWGSNPVKNRFSGSVLPENKDRSWQTPVVKQFYTSNTQQNDRLPEFIWKIVGYTSCSSTCAGGVQSGIVKCIRRTTRENVEDSKCALQARIQETRRVCNLQPCPASWVAQEWQACSKTCGKGDQIRDLMCKQVIERDGEKVTVMLPVNKCPVESRPEVIRKCLIKECPVLAKPKWVVESWSKCSVECGHGVQKREIVCKNYKNETVANFKCPLRTKPAVLKACYLGMCKANWYVRSEWSQCSRTCGSGYRSRPVVCARIQGSKVDEKHCKDKTKPKDEQTCNTKSCKGIWVTSEWSKCSTDCGRGLQQRVVICMKSVNGFYQEAYDADCSLDDKPAVRKDCSSNCPPSWFATPWTQCSVTCGHGVESRHVSCLNGEGKRVGGCKAWERPQLRRACYPKACPGTKPAKKKKPSTCKDNPPRYRKGYCHIIKRINYCRIPSYRRRCCETCSPSSDRVLGHI